MRIATMRVLDNHVGRPLAFLVTWLGRLVPTRPPDDPPRSILFIKFWGMGSLVCAAPLATALRERHPGVRIDVVTFPAQEGTVRLLGIADRILTISATSLPGFLLAAMRTFVAIRRVRYSAVIDLEFFSKFTALLAWFSGAPIRVGFDIPPIYRGHLFTHTMPFNGRLHVIRLFRTLGQPLGVTDAPAAYPRLAADAAATASAAAKLGDVVRRGYVVLNAGVSDHSPELRRWPLERYAELAQRLVADGFGVVLTGGPADVDVVGAIAREIGARPGVVDASGRLTLAELAAVLAGAGVVVTSDTGPMHLAVAAGAPVIAFFGTETPVLYGPIGPAHTVIHRDLPCSPCLTVYNQKLHVCRYQNVCMRSIGVEEVLGIVRAKLRQPSYT